MPGVAGRAAVDPTALVQVLMAQKRHGMAQVAKGPPGHGGIGIRDFAAMVVHRRSPMGA